MRVDPGARLAVPLFVLMGYAVAAAQAPTSRGPAFEVASVKQNVSGRVGGAIQVPPAGTLSFTNVMLRVLIREAYQVDAYAESYRLITGPFVRIIGSPRDGPQPDVPRFDVVAKPPANTEPAERRAMMRALLEDRFKLRVHREMRQMPVYTMTVAREGRLGPNLAPSKFDCQQYLTQRRFGGTAKEPVDGAGKSWCLSPVPGELSLAGIYVMRFAGPIQLFAQRTQPYVDRPIVDETGLSGNFEWVMTFAMANSNASADVPRIFTALQEQLGLKLEPRQAPVEVLVVDSVQLPTPD